MRRHIYRKGIYPYDYVNGPSKLDETALCSLTDEHINDKQYVHAHEMWERLSMKTMRDYTLHYMVLDVLILADLFEKFRHNMYNAHGLDCLHFLSLPSFTLQMALKMTAIELKLIGTAKSM